MPGISVKQKDESSYCEGKHEPAKGLKEGGSKTKQAKMLWGGEGHTGTQGFRLSREALAQRHEAGDPVLRMRSPMARISRAGK